MNTTLAYLRGRRAWLVENLAVWGTDSEAEFLMAISEQVGSDTRVGFWKTSLGGQLQDISFSTLIDNRGNNLPATIKSPAVIVMPRERQSAFIKAITGNSGFSIAKGDDSTQPVTVDIMVFETGL
jgi:hypothetical protein